jgi:methyl-accepting chemotaxis protein WspA
VIRRWTIRRRIVVSIGALLAVLLLAGGGGFIQLTRMMRSTQSLATDALPSLQHSNNLKSVWFDTYLLAQQYAFLQDREAIELLGKKLRGNRERLREAAAEYQKTLTAESERARFTAFQQVAADYLAAEEKLIDGAATRGFADNRVALVIELAPRFSDVDAALRQIDASAVDSANGFTAKLATDAVQQRFLIAASFVAVAIITTAICLFLYRTITRPLGQMLDTTAVVSRGDFTQRMQLQRNDELGDLAGAFDRMLGDLTELVNQVQRSALQVNSTVSQIAATATEQQATATEVAATTTEIGVTSREISATSKELVTTMNEVSVVAEQTAHLAGSGQAGLSRMEDTMRHVTQAATSISGKLSVLSEKAGNINQVVTTITKVADQTNLLSLNAAIEAEKAGEAGRGFAVVATEIRRLADQTAVATYDIEQTVKEIQSAVAASVMSMDNFSEQVRRGMQDVQQAGEQMTQIIQQVQTLAPRFVAVGEGMQAQATGAQQISDALTQLTESSQQTVQSLEHSNEAIGGLTEVAETLRGAVSRFRLA